MGEWSLKSTGTRILPGQSACDVRVPPASPTTIPTFPWWTWKCPGQQRSQSTFPGCTFCPGRLQICSYLLVPPGGSPGVGGGTLLDLGKEWAHLAALCVMGIRNAGSRSPLHLVGEQDLFCYFHKSTMASSPLFFFPLVLCNCLLSGTHCAWRFYLGLKCSEIVPLYDDFRSKAQLVFSEHMANACVMFNYKAVFDGWAGPS